MEDERGVAGGRGLGERAPSGEAFRDGSSVVADGVGSVVEVGEDVVSEEVRREGDGWDEEVGATCGDGLRRMRTTPV